MVFFFCQNFYISFAFSDYLVNLIIDLRAFYMCCPIISCILRSETRINLIWQFIGRFQLNDCYQVKCLRITFSVFCFVSRLLTTVRPTTLDRSTTVLFYFASLFLFMNHRFILSLALLIQSHTHNFFYCLFFFPSFRFIRRMNELFEHSSPVNTHQNNLTPA